MRSKGTGHCIDCNKSISYYAKRCKKCSCIYNNKHRIGNIEYGFKGDNATYKQKHTWMYRRYGRPYKCDNKECLGFSCFFEWANISGEYKREREDWIMSCHSCNQRMDYIRRNGNKCMKGHEYTEDNTRINKEGKRVCLICAREKGRLWRLKHKNTI